MSTAKTPITTTQTGRDGRQAAVLTFEMPRDSADATATAPEWVHVFPLGPEIYARGGASATIGGQFSKAPANMVSGPHPRRSRQRALSRPDRGDVVMTVDGNQIAVLRDVDVRDVRHTIISEDDPPVPPWVEGS